MIESPPPTATVERVLPASPEAVYDEWLDLEALADWMCPRPARATRIELEPKVGGRLRIEIEENGIPFVVTGRFVEIERGSAPSSVDTGFEHHAA